MYTSPKLSNNIGRCSGKVAQVFFSLQGFGESAYCTAESKSPEPNTEICFYFIIYCIHLQTSNTWSQLGLAPWWTLHSSKFSKLGLSVLYFCFSLYFLWTFTGDMIIQWQFELVGLFSHCSCHESVLQFIKYHTVSWNQYTVYTTPPLPGSIFTSNRRREQIYFKGLGLNASAETRV